VKCSFRAIVLHSTTLWHNGSVDCDGDALLAEVEPATGETPVCHTGAETCFFADLGSTKAR
jgi:phosphoribosyl-AMP cyclohydrolase